MKVLILSMIVLASAPLVNCNFTPKFKSGIIENDAASVVFEA